MSHLALGSFALKSIAGLVVTSACVVGGTRSSAVEAVKYTRVAIEASSCHGTHEDDHGHDNRSHDNGIHDDGRHDNGGRGRHGHEGDDDDGQGGTKGLGLRQIVTVQNPATVFLRVDKSGRVTSAATNTGCKPTRNDDAFFFRPGGAVEPATNFDLGGCDWTGDFSVPGRFQPQNCRADHHGGDR